MDYYTQFSQKKGYQSMGDTVVEFSGANFSVAVLYAKGIHSVGVYDVIISK